jgi:hypothetical protein
LSADRRAGALLAAAVAILPTAATSLSTALTARNFRHPSICCYRPLLTLSGFPTCCQLSTSADVSLPPSIPPMHPPACCRSHLPQRVRFVQAALSFPAPLAAGVRELGLCPRRPVVLGFGLGAARFPPGCVGRVPCPLARAGVREVCLRLRPRSPGGLSLVSLRHIPQHAHEFGRS